MPLEASSVPRLASKARLRWDRHEGKFLLLYPERGLVLNESASAIVRLMDGRRSIEEIARTLGAGATVTEVIAFLERLRERGLVQT